MNNRLILIIITFLILVGAAVFIFYPTNKTTQSKVSPQPPTVAPTPSIERVTLNQSGFSPSTITIKKGQTVSWINRSGSNATVNSASHPNHTQFPFLNLGEFPKDTTVQTVFENTGTFTYHNHLNPAQRGTVIVK